MKIEIIPKQLPLKHTFTIAHQSRDVQDTLIVKLSEGIHYGLGESTSNPFYGITIKEMAACLEEAIPTLERFKEMHPEELWERTKNHFPGNPFSQCALDMAAWDLYAKQQGKKLYELLELDPNNIPTTNFTIGIADLPNMLSKMKEVVWPIYKIKLGTDHDLEIIRELRKHTEAVFRVDANCAWTADQAIRYSEKFAHLNVEFLEQPLAQQDHEGMKEVFQHSKLPVIADESCITEEDVEKCHGLFHGINVKLVKAGGITPGLRMLNKAKSLGMKTMVGCMTESSVGISAIAHIAGMLDYVDMDGAMLLAKDIAQGVVILPDGVNFPDRPGTGAVLLPS
ncbi:MAG: dipeptide epimerase [Cyclobacteriaceae bacterium]